MKIKEIEKDNKYCGYNYLNKLLLLPPNLIDNNSYPFIQKEMSADLLSFMDSLSVDKNVLPKCKEHRSLFWFRWITGHQLTILFWRLLAAQLIATRNSIKRDSTNSHKELNKCTELFNACGSLFIYMASCSKEFYNTVIRQFMGFFHPAFSGNWCVDYQSIPQTVREILSNETTAEGKEASLMKKAYLENHKIHMVVAKKLVPNEPSLLKKFQQTFPIEVTPDENFIFDSFFLLKRSSINNNECMTALLARLKAVLVDLEANNLYVTELISSESSELSKDEIKKYSDEMINNLVRAALVSIDINNTNVATP